MKKILIKSVLIGLCILFCQAAICQLIPYCQKGKWGFSDKTGKIKIKCVYDSVDFFNVDALARVKKNGKVGYINNKEQIIIPFEYDKCLRIYEVFYTEETVGVEYEPEIHIAGYMNNDDAKNNRYIVTKNKKIGIIKVEKNKQNIIVPLIFSKIQFDPNRKIFNCNTKDGLRYFDLEGKEKILENVTKINPEEYSKTLAPEYENMKSTLVKNENSKFGIIKKDNNDYSGKKYDTIVPVMYDSIIFDENAFYDNTYTVKKDKKWGIIVGGNKIILPFEYDSINHNLSKNDRNWADDYKRLFVVKKEKNWGLIGKKNEDDKTTLTLLPFVYTGFNKIYYYYLLAQRGSKFQIYDFKKFKFINNKSYSSITPYKHESLNDFYLFQVTNKLGQTVFVGNNGVEFFED